MLPVARRFTATRGRLLDHWSYRSNNQIGGHFPVNSLSIAIAAHLQELRTR